MLCDLRELGGMRGKRGMSLARVDRIDPGFFLVALFYVSALGTMTGGRRGDGHQRHAVLRYSGRGPENGTTRFIRVIKKKGIGRKKCKIFFIKNIKKESK